MQSWTLIVCLVVSQLAELGCGKRFDPAMVDPLMRRSSLEKNFMRFGRSSPSYEEKEVEAEESPPGEDSYLRSMRGRDSNYMRFGRGRGDNYMRFGRGKQDSFMRFGRARNDNYMRFGRGKDNNFMRFGRGKDNNFMRFGRGRDDNYMRFGRGKEDNYMRFGRGKQDNFMRFGKGGVDYTKQDSFMRLGRGKQDNYMRFGRDFVTSDNLSSGVVVVPAQTEDDVLRIARGRQNNLMRFGKKSEEDPSNEFPFELQPVNPPQNLLRVVRGKQDNFIRFGKSDEGKSSQGYEGSVEKDTNESQNTLASVTDDTYPSEGKSTGTNAFVRYSRSSDDRPDALIPQRLKRSAAAAEGAEGYGDHGAAPEDLEEEYVVPVHQEDYSSRRKRSLAAPTPAAVAEDSSVVDYVSAKLRLRTSPPQPQYEASLLSAGLPNVIVGPEFSLLPRLDPPAALTGRPGDKSYLRLG